MCHVSKTLLKYFCEQLKICKIGEINETQKFSAIQSKILNAVLGVCFCLRSHISVFTVT